MPHLNQAYNYLIPTLAEVRSSIRVFSDAGLDITHMVLPEEYGVAGQEHRSCVSISRLHARCTHGRKFMAGYDWEVRRMLKILPGSRNGKIQVHE